MSEEKSAPCNAAAYIEMRDAGTLPPLLDVRNANEIAIASVGDHIHIPLDQIQTRVDELEPHKDSTLIVMCHHGMRSAMARDFLLSEGFTDVRNLTGGIDAISILDSSIPRY